jgi:crossover junction endodeoxyribonuclease RuvC
LAAASNIILGIDPGTIIMGFGVIKVTGNNMQLIDMDVLKISSKNSSHERLMVVFEKVTSLVKEHRVDQLAIEAPFFGKNVQSMLKLGRAQGVAIAAAIQQGIAVEEYSPRKIKQSITGNGNANKEQVMKMLQRMLSFTDNPKYLDATDGLAVAVCHHFQSKPLPGGAKRVTGWDQFLKENPQRLKAC